MLIGIEDDHDQEAVSHDEATSGRDATTDTPPDSGGERLYTEAELQQRINQTVRKRLARRGDSDRDKGRREPRNKQGDNDVGVDDLRQEIQRMKMESAINEAADDLEVPLTKGQKRLLRVACMAEDPGDVAEWMKENAAFFLAAKETKTESKSGEPQVKPPTQPIPPPGSAITDDTPLIEMSAEDRAHIVKTKGFQYYRNRLRKEMQNSKVLIRQQ